MAVIIDPKINLPLRRYQINWAPESNIVTVTVPTGVHATLDLPFEYPSAYPKIRVLKLDGVKSEPALQNFVVRSRQLL